MISALFFFTKIVEKLFSPSNWGGVCVSELLHSIALLSADGLQAAAAFTWPLELPACSSQLGAVQKVCVCVCVWGSHPLPPQPSLACRGAATAHRGSAKHHQ